MPRGTVKEWYDDLGWGVLTSPDAPDQVWAHHIHIRGQGDGYRTFNAGDMVEFEYIPAKQDGYAYRAIWVARLDSEEPVR